MAMPLYPPNYFEDPKLRAIKNGHVTLLVIQSSWIKLSFNGHE